MLAIPLLEPTQVVAPAATRSTSMTRRVRSRAPAGWAAVTAPSSPSSSTLPPVAVANSRTTARLPPCRAARVILGWTWDARVTPSYCCSAIRSVTARITAMNGVGSGTCSSGSPAASAAATTAGGTCGWDNPTPKPKAATPAASSRST